MAGAHRIQRALGSLELGSQMVVHHHVGAGNQIQFFGRAAIVLNNRATNFSSLSSY